MNSNAPKTDRRNQRGRTNRDKDDEEERATQDVEEVLREEERNPKTRGGRQDHRTKAPFAQSVLVVEFEPVPPKKRIGRIGEPDLVPPGCPEPRRNPRREHHSGGDERNCGKQERRRSDPLRPRHPREPFQRAGDRGEHRPGNRRREDEDNDRERVDAAPAADAERIRTDRVGVASDGLHVDRGARVDVEPPDVMTDAEVSPVQRSRLAARHGHGAGSHRSRRNAEIADGRHLTERSPLPCDRPEARPRGT